MGSVTWEPTADPAPANGHKFRGSTRIRANPSNPRPIPSFPCPSLWPVKFRLLPERQLVQYALLFGDELVDAAAGQGHHLRELLFVEDPLFSGGLDFDNLMACRHHEVHVDV